MSFEGLVGVAFYLPEDWEILRAFVPDPERLEDTYDHWLVVYESSVASLRSTGLHLKRVEVRADQLREWCQRTGRRPDGAARAEYVSDLLRRLTREGFILPDA